MAAFVSAIEKARPLNAFITEAGEKALAMADASERYTAASSQIDQATTVRQAALAKESAIEGLYYVRAARTAMGMDPGPELESLTGQRSAGAVTEDRRINFDGREIEASPTPSGTTSCSWCSS